MSDNGWMLGDHGFTSKVLPYKASTHVPFFIIGPDIERGLSHALVSNLDIMPTILDLAGIAVPDEVHGKSLSPILEGPQTDGRSPFVYEGLGSYGSSHYNLTVIKDNYRYIVTYADSTLNEVEYKELYNYDLDALELINEEGNPDYHRIIEDCEQKINAHRKDILQQELIL